MRLLPREPGIASTVRRKDGIAYCLEGTAGILVAGDSALPEAAHLFGAAAALRRAIHMPLSPMETLRYERHVAAARAALGDAAFEQAWESGARLPLSDVVTRALALLGGPGRPGGDDGA